MTLGLVLVSLGGALFYAGFRCRSLTALLTGRAAPSSHCTGSLIALIGALVLHLAGAGGGSGGLIGKIIAGITGGIAGGLKKLPGILRKTPIPPVEASYTGGAGRQTIAAGAPGAPPVSLVPAYVVNPGGHVPAVTAPTLASIYPQTMPAGVSHTLLGAVGNYI